MKFYRLLVMLFLFSIPCCIVGMVGFSFALYAGRVVSWLSAGAVLVWPTNDDVILVSLYGLISGFILATLLWLQEVWRIIKGRHD